MNGGTDGPKPFGWLASPLGGAAKRGVHPINDQPPRLGYSSITHTAHNPPSEPLPDPVLSELIQNAIGKATGLSGPYMGLIEDFLKWAEMVENYWISVKTIKPFCKCVPGKYWGYDHHARPLHNRFSYQRRIVKLARVYRIIEYESELNNHDFTLITLTASHDGGWYETMDRLCKGRDRLLKLLRKYLHADYPRGIRYVWVPEPHESGFPHIHLLVSARVDNTVRDSQGRGMEDKLRDLWSGKWALGSHTFGLDFEYMETPDKALNYMLKYVGKSFVDRRGWSEAELIFNAHLYGSLHDERIPEEDRRSYRSLGMCNEYSDLFPKKKKEPSVTLDARLFPLSDELDLPEKNCMKGGPRPQLIPDWLGNVNLIASINAGRPDYTTRFEYDPRTGRRLPRPSSHWGRPHVGFR